MSACLDQSTERMQIRHRDNGLQHIVTNESKDLSESREFRRLWRDTTVSKVSVYMTSSSSLHLNPAL